MNWKVNDYEIDYCLSQLVPPHCKLQFSLTILGVVIAMNFCKCVSMFWTVFWQKSTTLVTVGDALASFLDSPDAHTQGRCLTGKFDIDKGPLQWQLKDSKSPNTQPPAIAYHTPIRRRWFAAASTKRWIISMGKIPLNIVSCITKSDDGWLPSPTSRIAIGKLWEIAAIIQHSEVLSSESSANNAQCFLGLCIAALIVAASLLRVGVTAVGVNGQDPFKLGFGAVDSRTLVTSGIPTSLVGAVLIANLPQAIASLLYLTYNGLLTSMLLSNEWARKLTPSAGPSLC